MVIDSNNQIAFTNLQSKSFPQAETEPRSQKGECVLEQDATEPKLSSTGSRRPTETFWAASSLEDLFRPAAVESELTWMMMLAWVVSSQSLSRVYVHRPGK